jgi:2-polyprenyl-3-methyl-5-hydroxy-6-metoxy-1,4-benzoquinol methylase
MPIDPNRAESFGRHEALGALVARQSAASPRHVAFFQRRFGSASEAELELCNELARQTLRLAGDDINGFFAGYDFICDIQKREEIHFRRNNAYRLKTVQEAIDQVYSNRPYMQSYMRGLLMTQVFWSNHTAAMDFYLNEFLRRNAAGYDHLEIGPGHGLLFSRAAADSRARSLTGWDLSPASVAETQEALAKLGTQREYALEVRNLFDSASVGAAFDSIVFSEVLEHLEAPEQALRAIRGLLRPGGRVYINVPVNSPAPDHVFLLRSPEEAIALVEAQGFAIERSGFFPATNYSLDAARRHALTITVCIVATRPVS